MASLELIDPFADLAQAVARREALNAGRAADEAFREAQVKDKLDMFTPQGRAAIARHRGDDPEHFEREYQRGLQVADRLRRRARGRLRPVLPPMLRRAVCRPRAASRRRDARRVARLVASSASGSGDAPSPPPQPSDGRSSAAVLARPRHGSINALPAVFVTSRQRRRCSPRELHPRSVRVRTRRLASARALRAELAAEHAVAGVLACAEAER